MSISTMYSGDIHTVRLRLRRLTPADRPALLEMLGDLRVTRNLARWPHPVDPAMVDELLARHQTDTPGGYAICYGDEFAGLISAGPKMGFMLSPEFWGLGIMTEALAAVQTRALQSHEALGGGAFVDNPASARVFEKCGWREVASGVEFSPARGEEVASRIFVKCARYDWLEPIETARLVMRPLGPQDFDAVWEMVSDAGIVGMLMTWPKEPDVELTKERVSNAAARAGLVSAIEFDGTTIGMIGCTGGSIWYSLRRAYWGRGFGTEALHGKITRAFADPSVTRLVAGTWHDNPASMKILEKSGFQQTGWGEVYCDGRDAVTEGPDYELTRARWEALH